MKLLKFILYYILGVLGIIVISVSPALFQGKNLLNITPYLEAVRNLTVNFVQPQNWVYRFNELETNILTALWDPFTYSMQVLIGALLLGFSLAFVLAILTIFLPKPLLHVTKRVLNVFEAFPDLMLAFLIQLLIVYIYKHTNVKIMGVAAYGEHDIYLAPIIVLAILPMISSYKVVLLLMEEELTRHYVEFAQSKGVKFKAVILLHVIRNITKSVFYHSKIILWGTLSSLFAIEYLFNLNGITGYILEDFRPLVVAVALWMIFTPFYVFYQGTEFFLFKTLTPENDAGIRSTFDWKSLGNWRIGNFWRYMKDWKPWNGILRPLKELGVHLKNPKFLFGFIVIFGILSYSIIHTVVLEQPVEQTKLVYDEEGYLLGAPPHPPASFAWLGTDEFGFSILDQIIVGAKYTIIFGFIIAFLRMLFGFLLAIPFAMVLGGKGQRAIEKFVDSFHFLPLSIIALILLRPILLQSQGMFMYSFTERIVLEILILTVLVVPLITVLIGNEMKLLLSQEFIKGARVLGGGSFHILTRHLVPHLASRLGIVFGQQFIQVLFVLIHLGLFDLFFGGTIITPGNPPDPPRSFSNEWSGLISSAKNAFMTGKEWTVIPVLAAFIILIIAMQFIVEGIKEVQQARVGVYVERSWLFSKLFRRKRHKITEHNNAYQPAKENFTFSDKKYTNHL